jgi:ABC-2 type transport system ATP-binding protein
MAEVTDLANLLRSSLRSSDMDLSYILDKNPVVEAKGISKRYGSVNAVSDVDLKIMPGEVYGLLGPNGAGKSTMIKIIAGVVESGSGSVRVMGHDPKTELTKVKSLIGYVPETSILYDSLSPRDFFEFIASVRHVDPESANKRVAMLASAFGLEQYYDSLIATLSMGTKQKIAIIASLLHSPPLLLLDEPLNGLDSKSSRIVKDLIMIHTRKNGGAVLFSTHIMEIAENICDRIGIIYEGKIVAEGSLAELRAMASKSGSSTESASLEEVFLKLTHEEERVEETVRALREAFIVR